MPENAQTQSRLLARAEAFVRARLEANACGHDFHHIHRVRVLALRIAPEVGADAFLVELGALLHDVADPKLNASPEAGRRALGEFLDGCGLGPATRSRLEDILERVSFGSELDGRDANGGKSGKEGTPGNTPAAAPKSPELQAVQDADRLDAIGALGIARAFAYGGSKGQAMHDPDLPPRQGLDQAAYRSGKSTSVNHFHEKLFKLKDRLNTAAGKAMAAERHRFMAEFLDRFMAEWDAKV
jgi:uncharacterized protein